MGVYAMAREHSIVCFITVPKQNLIQTLLAYNFCLSQSWKAIISMLNLASSYYLSGNYRKMEKPSKIPSNFYIYYTPDQNTTSIT